MNKDRIEVSVESADEKSVTDKDAKTKKQALKKEEKEEKPVQKGPPKSVVREYFESLVVTVIMALFGITFILQAVKVPTGSMQNTITIGDHLIVNKFIFAPPGGSVLPFLPQREIRRGDIIVFKYPGYPEGNERDTQPDNIPYKTNYVKRVIGLPGDKVEVRGRDVYINDRLLPEHRIEATDFSDPMKPLTEKMPLRIDNNPPGQSGEMYDVYFSSGGLKGQEPVVVPPNNYFVMGDNRNNSADSRFWGFVRRDLVIGRAMFVYWSYDESKPGSFPFSIFSNTDWKRTGKMIK